jgi:predicted nucleic acid-binding protein
VRIYLDACCLCRPFDDHGIDRNRLESEAIVMILDHVHRGEWELVGSETLDWELNSIPDWELRELVAGFRSLESESLGISIAIQERSEELLGFGFKPTDALHIACAESGNCDVLLTTDDRFLKAARRNADQINVRVENPLQWISEQLSDEFDTDDVE